MFAFDDVNDNCSAKSKFIIKIWNKYVAPFSNAPRVKCTNLKRTSAILKLFETYSFCDLRMFLRNAKKSTWLLSQPWFNFDWLLEHEDWIENIMNGNSTISYGNQYSGESVVSSKKMRL